MRVGISACTIEVAILSYYILS